MTIANVETKNTGKENMSYMWTMFYRHGMNANLTKGFYFEGTLFDAKRRAEDHCRIMGYRFIFIRPMISNLDNEEEYQMKGPGKGELYP